MGPLRGVAADAYAPVRSEDDPSATHLPLSSPSTGSSGLSGAASRAPPLAAALSSAGGFVNEVTFGFFDGAADGPTVDRRAFLRGSASPRRVANHGALFARANVLQHMAGGSGVAGPATMWNQFITIALLVMLGIIPSTIIFLVDVCVHNLFLMREAIAVEYSGGVTGFSVYLASGVALCLLSTFACHLCSTDAEGSGIPQMKCIMSGFYDKLKSALSVWALLAKGVGLVCAIGGGLPVGWEGPNVHISCIVAHHLSRLPFFQSLRRDRALRMQIMACACAVGLASSFGTPIGGVLYALETTASFYLVPTFWKSIVATLAGALVYDLLYKTPLVEAFENTSFEAGDYTRNQLVNFAVMGVLFGLLGSFFVRCVHSIYLLRKKRFAGTNRYVLLGVVGTIAALVQYPLRLFRLDPRLAINQFFSATNLESLSSLDVALLLLIKFPLIVVCIGLPIPAGVFIPCFLLGSGMGRLYGEGLRMVLGDAIVPGGYAVVGAAAFTAGVTRALSCAVVIFEVTGQLKHMEPTLVAVTLSVVVANSINRSLYDTLIIMKEYPYMPHMRRDRSPAQVVSEVMHTDIVALDEQSTLGTVREALDSCPSFDSFPVVSEAMGLLGSVRRRSLVGMLNKSGPEDIDANGVVHPYGNSAVVSMAGNGVIDRKVPGQSQVNGASAPRGEQEQALIVAEPDGNQPAINGGESGVDQDMRSADQGDVAGQTSGGGAQMQRDVDLSAIEGNETAVSSEVDFAGDGGNGVGEPKPTRNSDEEVPGNGAHVSGVESHEEDEYGADRPVLLVPDLSPMVVTENTSLSQLHFMFVMLMPTHALVLSQGRLCGYLCRGDIVQTGQVVVENSPPR